MKLRTGTVLRKTRGGGTKRCEVVAVTKTHATLRPLASTAQHKSRAVSSLVVRLDEDGLPEGYEVAS